MRTVLRRAALVIAALVTILAVPAVGAAASAPRTFVAAYTPGPDRAVPTPTPPPHDPVRPTAVVVVGDHGALVSDVLAPDQVLAETGASNLSTVAVQRRPLPLTGRLDLVPDLTSDELAARTGRPSARADRLVVPGATAPPVAVPADAPPPEYLHRGTGFAYDAVVTDLARHTDTATARWTAEVLELPTDGLVLQGPSWPWAPTLLLGLLLPGAAVVLGAAHVLRVRRETRTTAPGERAGSS